MTPLLLVCSLCLPVPAATAQLGLGQTHEAATRVAWREAAPAEPLSPPTWQTPALVASMGAFAVGGNALAASRGFNIGRLALDESAMVVGSLVGIAGVLWGSFAFGPKEGGLLLPLSERKIVTVLLLGGVVGGIGALAAVEAAAGRLDHPWALLGGAGGFLVTSGVIVALVDGLFGLPVWANALMVPLGLAGGTVGGYALAIPRR
jgi:hypothetical protein